MAAPIRNTAFAAAKNRGAPTLLLKSIKKGAPANEPRNALQAVITALEYEDTTRRASRMSITVDNYDGTQFDAKQLMKGSWLEATFGYPDNLSPPIKVVIQRTTGGKALKVEAIGLGILMHKEPKTKVWTNKKRSDVVRDIAKANGYVGARADIDDTELVMATITQSRTTDWKFLRKLALAEGFDFWIDFDGLHFHRVRMAQKPIRELRYFTAPITGEILDYDIENDVLARAGVVNLAGYDPKKKKRITGKGDNDSSKREGTANIVDEIDVLDKTQGTVAVEHRPSTATNQAEMKRRAGALYAKAQRRAIKLKLVIIGDPSLVTGSVIKVTGIAELIDGFCAVKVVTHKVEPGSYTCELSCETDRGTGKGRSKAKQPQGGAADTAGTSAQEDILAGDASQGTRKPDEPPRKIIRPNFGRGQ